MATETFQVQLDAAELYESAFVPALFAPWAPRLLDVLQPREGERLLDVACGTGIVARTAADRLGDSAVIGADINDAMLAVARRVRPGITWQQADASALPFPDGSFEIVTCQMALMFFPHRARALRELARVTSGTGRVGLVVPDVLAQQPAYREFVDIAIRHAGSAAEPLLSAYWSCGDLDELRRLLADAGLQATRVETQTGTVSFGSVEDFVTTEVNASPLAALLRDEAFAAVVTDTGEALAEFTDDAGALAAPFRCHLVAARHAT